MSWFSDLRNKVQQTSKDLGVTDKLNQASAAWNEFWDKPMTIQYAHNPYEVVANKGPQEVTQRRGDVVKQVALASSVPALAAGVVTAGVPATISGFTIGTATGAAGSYGGKKAAQFIGLDKNGQEMLSDFGGLIAGSIGVKYGGKTGQLIGKAESMLRSTNSTLKYYIPESRIRMDDPARSAPILDLWRLQFPTRKTGSLGYGHKYRSSGNYKALKKQLAEDVVGTPSKDYQKYDQVYWSENIPLREYTKNSPYMLVYDKSGPYQFGKGNFGNPISKVSDPIHISDPNVSLHVRRPFTSKYVEIPKTQEALDATKIYSDLINYVETPARWIKNGIVFGFPIIFSQGGKLKYYKKIK